ALLAAVGASGTTAGATDRSVVGDDSAASDRPSGTVADAGPLRHGASQNSSAAAINTRATSQNNHEDRDAGSSAASESPAAGDSTQTMSAACSSAWTGTAGSAGAGAGVPAAWLAGAAG